MPSSERIAILTVLFVSAIVSAAPRTVRLGEREYAPLKMLKHSEYECTVTFAPPSGKSVASAFDVVFAARDAKNYGRVVADARGVRVERIRNGKTEILIDAKCASSQGQTTLTLKRGQWWLDVIRNGVRVARVLESTLRQGALAAAVGPDMPKVTAASYQRTGPVIFGDDFMRTEEETTNFGAWEPSGGEWKLYSVIEQIKANPDARIREGRIPDAAHSVNPFCLSCKSPEPVLVTTGYLFWHDYAVSVTAKTTSGRMGLAFGVADSKNYWVARWTLTSVGIHAGKVELVRVAGGKEHIVRTAAVYGRTDNWYRLEVRTAGSRIDVLIDNTLAMTARDPRCVGGKIGLYAQSANETYFDDVDVRSWRPVDLDRAEALADRGRALSGNWHRTDGAFVTEPAKGERAYVMGLRDWPEMRYRATIEPAADAQAFGLVFAYDESREGRFEWSAEGGGRGALLIRSGSKWKTVVSATLKLDRRKPHELAVDLTDGKLVKVYVDSVLELRCRAKGKMNGKVGLFVRGGGTTKFRRVTTFAPSHRDWEQSVNVELFAEDPYMQGWASPRQAWIPMNGNGQAGKPRLHQHKGDFYGAFEIKMPISNGLGLLFGADKVTASAGYRVAVRIHDKKDRATVTLERGGRTLKKRSIREGPRVILPGEQIVDEKVGPMPVAPDTVSHGTLTVAREGKYIWARADGRELFSVREDAPLWGRAVGLSVNESLDLARVQVRRDHVKDYVFERAAADWLKVGTWEVTNRFACDPRWSHMNGRSKGVATLWHKHEFDGDFTLEYYAGMRMRQGEMREGVRTSYPRVGDINVAMAPDPRDLFSGYNLIIAAWDSEWSERWTQFWRREKVAKQTERELIPRTRDQTPRARIMDLEWDPGGRPIHGAWYYVKVRKTGPRFDFFFDNIPVMSYVDPSPLACRRIALWTQQNSIVVARVKIGYSRVSEGGAYLAPKPEAEPVLAAAGPSLRCDSHPGARFDFERGVEGWAPTSGDQSAGLSLDAGDRGGKRCLRVTNLYAGGDFGVRVPLPPMDLGRVARFEFDCAIPPSAKVNMYIRFKDVEHDQVMIQLSGPDRPGRDMVKLGAFKGFKADGKWRHVSFDVAAALRKALPEQSSFVLEDMRIGQFDEGYLNAGLGGNRQGASYHIDNFEIASFGPSLVQLAWENASEVGIACRAVLSKKPNGDLPTAKTQKAGEFRFENAGAGWWYVNSAVQTEKTWARQSPIPVYVDRPLDVVHTDPGNGKSWGGGPLRITFDSSRYAMPDMNRLSLKVGQQTMNGSSKGMSYDTLRRTLIIDTARGDVAFADGETVPFELTYADNLEWTPAKGTDKAPPPKPTRTHRWTARMDFSSDQTPPTAVTLVGDYVRTDFDESLGGWTNYGSKPGVSLKLDRSDAASGAGSLAVINRQCGSYLAARLAKGPLDLGKTPVIAFDYRLEPYSRIDLMLRTGLGSYAVGIADNETTLTRIGQVENVKTDRRWHHAEIDVKRMLDASSKSFSSRRYVTKDLTFCDWGHAAAPPGVEYHLDNFQMIPTVSSAQALQLKWQAHDASDIQAYSCVWSRKPDDEPKKARSTDKPFGEFRGLPEGDMYFHIRAQDGAGNWGPTSHFRFIVDNTPPQVASVWPTAGSGAAAASVTVGLKDKRAGIDPAGVSLLLDGQKCSLSSSYTSLDPAKGEFAYNWVAAKRYMRAPIPDGKEMRFRLAGITDFAGNAAKPVEWKWRLDYSKDREGPAPPSISCYSQSLLQYDHFTESTGKWSAYGGGDRGTQIEPVIDPDTKDYCLRVHKTAQERRFGAYALRRTVSCATYRRISFDYKIPKGVKVNLILYFNTNWYTIRMNGPETYPALGRIENATDDGKWHHASLNIYDILRKRFPDEKKYYLRYLTMGCWAALANKVGAEFFVDNFCVMGDGHPLPYVSASALDPTGIRDFSYHVDRHPVSTPDEEADGPPTTLALPPLHEPGLSYIHVRARDGAGNWGRAAHYPYFCTDVVPPAKEDGIEAEDGWSARGSSRKTTAYAKTYRSAMANNAVLGLRIYARSSDKITLRRSARARARRQYVCQTDLYNAGGSTLKVAAYVRLDYPAQTVISPLQELPARTWQRGRQFEIDLSGHIDKARARRRRSTRTTRPNIRERGFIIYAPGQKRYVTLLFDNVSAGGDG